MPDVRYKNYRILVVDDEQRMAKFIRLNLEHDGFRVVEAFTGTQAMDRLRISLPDLVLLDVMLPEMDGFTVCEAIRLENPEIPVLFLTAKNSSSDRVYGLKIGADDYLTKPFGVGELLARIRTVLRRQAPNSVEPVFTIGNLVVDLGNRLVMLEGKEVQLTPTEYDILRALVINAGKVITNHQILRKVWGEGYDDLHILRVNISNLRHKIEPEPTRPRYVLTELGVGYRLKI